MEQFNPFRDLSPPDRERAIQQLGGANENDLQQIGLRLKFTSAYTKQFIDVLRFKNKSFNQDISRIKYLDDRLKQEIPIIPMMAGIAGNLFGEEGYEPGPFAGFPGFPPTGGLPGRVPSRPRVPSEVPEQVPESERIRQLEEAKIRAQKEAEQRALEEARKRKEGVDRALEILEELYPEVRPDKGVPSYVPTKPIKIPKPGVTPADIQQTIESARKGAKSRGKPFVIRRPDDFVVIATPDGQIRVLSREQVLQANRNIRMGELLIGIPQSFLDAFPTTGVRRPRAGTVPVIEGPPGGTGGRTKGGATVTPIPQEQVPRPGAPVGGEREVRRLRQPAAPGTVRGGMTSQDRATVRTLEDISLEQQQRRASTTPQGEQARRDFERDIQGPQVVPSRQRPPKRAITPQQQQRIVTRGEEYFKRRVNINKALGKSGLTEKDPEFQELSRKLEAFVDPGFTVNLPKGSVGYFAGLDNFDTRARFIDYLMTANPPAGKKANMNFIDKILRGVGLEGRGPSQVDNSTTRFILNFFKREGINPKPFFEQLRRQGLIDTPTYSQYAPRVEMESREEGRRTIDVNPQNIREKLQSLNIDTNVENTVIVIMKPRFKSTTA
jgi:hypothetical protein